MQSHHHELFTEVLTGSGVIGQSLYMQVHSHCCSQGSGADKGQALPVLAVQELVPHLPGCGLDRVIDQSTDSGSCYENGAHSSAASMSRRDMQIKESSRGIDPSHSSIPKQCSEP